MARAPLAAGAVRGFNCPSCAAAITMRGLAWTQVVACATCGVVVDARDPNLAILQRADRAHAAKPVIPLGTRGEWHGAPYEVIGFQVREIRAEGVAYAWREYVLFNPYRGFRYLTEYDGHWNDVLALPAVPSLHASSDHSAMQLGGESYRHFQTAQARTIYILGEFPWQVRVGDTAETRDYVSPPRVLSAEVTPAETTWSLGEYADPRAVWAAFRLQGTPPSPRGVYANQPSPHQASTRSLWRTFGMLMLGLLALFTIRQVTARREVVYSGRHDFDAANTTPSAFVTPSFALQGSAGSVVIETSTNLDNAWLSLGLALVNEGTGRAWDFGRDVSYYTGRDSDGAWSEGSRRDRVRLGPIPAGRYFLRVEPEGQPGTRPVTFELRVRRDVPAFSYYLIALLLLVAPPVFAALRNASFEQQRWAESDHAPSTGGDEDEEE